MRKTLTSSSVKIFKAFLLVIGLLLMSRSFATDRYWIGGNGNWSSTAHWSATSGGASCGCTPTATDNVYFDANSFTANGQSVNVDVIAYCDSMNWSGISFSTILTGAQALHINGSLTLSSISSVVNFTGTLYFESTNAGNRITSSGKNFGTNVAFTGSGDWTLQDAFATSGGISHTNGTLATNNKNLTCNAYSSTGANVRSLILGSSTVTVAGGAGGTAWNVTGSNFALDAGTSLIKFTTTGGYTYLTAGTNDVYYDVMWTNPGTGGYINGGSSSYHNVTSNGGGNFSPGGSSSFYDITFIGSAAGTVSPGSGSTVHNVVFGGNGTINSGSGSNYHNVTFTGVANINTNGNTFNIATFNSSATISNTNGSFAKALLYADGNITSSNSFDSLIFSPGFMYTLTYNTIQTINSYLKADGNCSQLVTIKSNSAGNQATISKTSGTVAVTYVSLTDIKATGGATFTASNCSNLSNNTGWIITSPATQNFYWIGGSGNWSNTAHWSNTSGGTPAACIPTKYDNVYFDANSFTANGQNVTIDVVAYCDSMNWTGITFSNILTGTFDLHVFGSLRLSPTLNPGNFTGDLYIESANAGNKLQSFGKMFGTNVRFAGAGDWTMLDAFGTSSNMFLTNGTLSTGNNGLTIGAFSCTGTNARSLVLGTSTVNVTAGGGSTAWNVTGSNFALDAGTSLIRFTTTGGYTYLTAGTNDTYYDLIWVNPGTGAYINGGGSTYHNVISNGGGSISPGSGSFFNDITFNGGANATVSPGSGSTVHDIMFGGNGTASPGNGSTVHDVTFNGTATINTSGTNFNNLSFAGTATVSNSTGSFKKANFMNDANLTSSNTFDSLFFASGQTYKLTSGTIQTVNTYMKATGVCGQLITMQATTQGSQAIINKVSGSVTADYVSLRDISATGGANFTANNATDLGDNTGWTINTATGQNLYWVGGNGNWSNAAHWSTTSGGAPGTCIPTIYDNVFFDANSFTANGQSVTIDIIAHCDSMDWSGITHSNIMTGTGDLYIYGSLKLSPNSSVINYSGNLFFASNTANNRITSAGKSFGTNIYFTGVGDWTQQDAFTTTSGFYLLNGTWATNNNTLNIGIFSSTGTNVRSLILGTSTVNVSGGGGSTAWNVTGSNFALDAGTSLIRFTTTSGYTYLTAGTNDTYYDLIWVNPGTGAYINGGASTYHNIISNGGGSISPSGGSFFNDITFVGGANCTVSPGAGSIVHNIIFGGNATLSPGAGSTVHNATCSGTLYMNTSGTGLNDVSVAGAATINNSGGTFRYANLMGDADLNTTMTFDSLIFAAGHLYRLGANNIITITYDLKADGTCTLPLTIHSNNTGTAAFLNKLQGTVTVSYALIKDIHTSGGATFNAASSTDQGNNTGWNFPTAVLSASYTHTQNALAVNFTNTSQYATSFNWNFGDGNNSTLQNPVHTYASPGNYNVCLIASDACGATDTICQTLTVCSPLATGFTYTVTGQTINFTNISQNASSFQWSFGDGGTSTAVSPFHTYYYAGGYYVTLIARSACGAKDTIRQFISVNCTSPVAGFASSPNGLLVSFVNSSTNAASVLWDYGDGTSSTNYSSSHTYFNTGTYNVCLIVKNGCGYDTLCQSVSVTCVPPVAAYSYITSGMTVNFNNTSSNAPVAHWDFGDGQTSTQNNPTHVYNNAGTYNAKLVVNNGCGSDSVTQVVNIVCVQPVASFMTSQQGLAVDFVSTSTNAPNVIWNFGDGTGISILPVVSHTFMTTGVYNVCLTATNGCGSNTYCTVISVCTPPTASFTYVDSVLTATFTSTSLNGTNFMWNFGDSSVTNLENPTHVYTTSGQHQVCLTVSNACGFSSTCKNLTNYCSYYMNPQICLVTVDSSSINNIVYWEKPNVTGLDSFVVYREVTSGTYKRIGAVSKDSMSMFVDTARSIGPSNGDPNVGTYRYKIQAVDSCGNYGPKSPYHNTIFFVNNNTGTFTWNKYLIEGQSATPITQFNLLRDNANNGIWTTIGTVAGTQTTLSDPLFSTYQSIANWRVQALGFNCNPTFRLANNSTQGTVVKSKSNISNNRQIGVNAIAINQEVMLYPNPSSNLLTIEGSGQLGQIIIYNSLGAEMYNAMAAGTSHTLDVSSMSNGIYFVQLKNAGVVVTKKFTVQH